MSDAIVADEELAELDTLVQSWLCFPPSLVRRLAAALRARNEQVDQLAEAMRTCMKDLQEFGVIFAPGDPPYDLLVAYDEESSDA